MLNNIKIVLANPSHPGNIGSVARAMKNMGLNDLVLVAPKKFPDEQATALAANAKDILTKATITDSLDKAVSEANLVIGTRSTDNSMNWPTLTANQAAKRILTEIKENNSKIVIVFGRESTGLSIPEQEKCHVHIQIPANREYASLNLSQAVQIICYEIFNQSLNYKTCVQKDSNYTLKMHQLAKASQLEYFLGNLESAMKKVGFYKEHHPQTLMSKLKKLFFRTKLTNSEIGILNGFISAINKKIV